MNRISNLRLGQIELGLTERDKAILRTIRQLRFVKTDQLRRLYFPNLTRSLQASKTAAIKKLNRFKADGLVDYLPREYNKARYGAQSLIWYLTEAGNRLLDLGIEDEKKRKRTQESSPTFLRHTIAVAECFVQVTEICRGEEQMRLTSVVVEPECWRAYEHKGMQISLRPDLYAETVSGKYFDHWFIEIDLATESISTIINKCKRYHEYYLTNKEQHATGVFPLALWIVPTEERKQKMIEAIKETFGNRRAHIFLVITPDELRAVLQDGAPEDKLC